MSSSRLVDATNAAVGQAIGDGIANTPEGLSVRQLIPGLDLLDKNGNEITDYSWVQTHTVDNQDELIYNGIRDGDSKVVAISSVMALGSASLYTTSIRFDKGSAVAQLIDIQGLEVSNRIEATAIVLNPVLVFKKGQDAKIYFRGKTGATGKTDQILLNGAVAEPRGTYVNE